jgi:hypothetical protein
MRFAHFFCVSRVASLLTMVRERESLVPTLSFLLDLLLLRVLQPTVQYHSEA